MSELKRCRAALLAVGIVHQENERKVHVFVLSDRNEYLRFRRCRAFDYISLLSTDSDAVDHEYIHAAVSATWPLLPPWMQEGLAEFCSTATPTKQAVKVGGFKWEYLNVIDRLSGRMLGELCRPTSD